MRQSGEKKICNFNLHSVIFFFPLLKAHFKPVIILGDFNSASKIKQFFSENIFYLLSHKYRHLPSPRVLALASSSLDMAQLQQSYGEWPWHLRALLGRWELRVQTQKRAVVLPVPEQGS